MALTTTQVNQAFLATLGRPAEGSAATWGSTSLSLGALSDSIFIAENTEDFVESLYTEILGRASDAEGKAFWNSLLATTSKEAVLAQFKAAVIAAGQADPSNADYQSFIAQNKAFVATLYANLLGRDDAKTADAEGIDFWANALATGMSRGDLISAFVSAALSDPNSDDAQTLNAKLSVADAYTAAFNDFGKDVTADEKKAAYAQLVEQMKEVVAGSTVEEFQDTINQFKGQNQDRKTDVFTKGEDDLDASESTAATTFRGTINISDSEKSTIESGDAATGNSEYAAANTLIVDVKSDGKEKDFNFGTETAGVKVSNVNNLTINNGTADVTLNLTGGDNYTGKVAITGKGDTANVTVDQEVASLSVSTSGAKKAYADTTVTATATLGSFEGSAAVDTLNISGTIAKSINTGDGKDSVTLDTNAKVYEKATISLGGGDDTLTINTSNIGNYNADGEITENLKASVTIDGGAGTKDKLVLNSDISAGVKAVTGVEFIDSTNGAISAAAADGLKTTVSGGLTINANYKEVKSINLKDIKSFTNDSKEKTGYLTVQNVTNENITLSSNIKENIVVKAHETTTPKNYAEINKFGEDDTIKVGDLSGDATQVNNKALDLTRYADVKSTLSGKTTGDVVAINDVNGKKAYIWQVLDSNDARLVAIVDKKLKFDGTSFVYDDGKEPTITVQSLKYVDTASGATIDLKATDGKGTYDVGGTEKSFNAPLGDNDVLVISSVVTAGSNGLKVSDTGSKSTGTVAAIVTGKVGNIVKDDAAATAFNGTLDVYLGGYLENDKIAAGLSNVGASSGSNQIAAASIKGADNIYANTTGTIYLDNAANLAGKKINLSIDGAKLDLSAADLAVDNKVIDVNKYVVNVDASDTITFKAATTTSGDTIKGSAGVDNITLKAATGALTVDLGNSTGDFLDAKAAVMTTSATLAELVTVQGLSNGGVAGIKLLDAGNLKLQQAQESEFETDLKTTLENGMKKVNPTTSNANDLFVVKVVNGTAEQNGLYVIANLINASSNAIENGDIVLKLVGVNTVNTYNDGTNDVGIVIA